MRVTGTIAPPAPTGLHRGPTGLLIHGFGTVDDRDHDIRAVTGQQRGAPRFSLSHAVAIMVLGR